MTSNRNASMQAPTKPTENARQGETSGHMRWVLGGSLVLIIATFSAVYAYSAIFGAHQ